MRQADPGIPGPKISDDIQLTYQLDDVGFMQRGSYGVGSFLGPVGNRFGGVDLFVTSPGGILVRDVIETIPTGLPPGPQGDLVTMKTSANQVAFDLAAKVGFPRVPPGSPQIAEGPPPLVVTTEGYTDFFLSGYIFVVRDHPLAGSGGFFVRFGRHLQIFNNQVGKTSGITVLYDELLRDERQPNVGP